MEKITTTIITYNEEENIEECLKSVLSFSDEIVVVDSFSTDKTVQIARKYTNKIFKQEFLGYANQKNLAIKKAKYDWIFSIDADERVSLDLQKEILTLKKHGFEYDAYYVNRYNYYIVDWMKYGGWYPDKRVRLFKKNIAKWQGRYVHEKLKVKKKAKIFWIKKDLLHYTYKNLSAHLLQIDKFSTLSGQEKYKKNKKFVTLHLIFNPIFKFIKTYFIQGAFLKGEMGFIFSVMASFSVFMKYAKLWEIQNAKKNKK